jgi:hypothetical protein
MFNILVNPTALPLHRKRLRCAGYITAQDKANCSDIQDKQVSPWLMLATLG